MGRFIKIILVACVTLSSSLASAQTFLPEGATNTDRRSVSVGGEFWCKLDDAGMAVCHTHEGLPYESPAKRFRSISVGKDHACGVDQYYQVECWGSNSYGKAVAPSGKFRSVSVSDYHSCAVGVDGIANCWGANFYGMGTPPDGLVFEQVSAGKTHTCGIDDDAALHCWGQKPQAEKPRWSGWWVRWFPWLAASKPKPYLPKDKYKQVAAGDRYTCGLNQENELSCTAFVTEYEPEPTGDFVAVSVGADFGCAITTAGSTKCWSTNRNAMPAEDSDVDLVNISVGQHRACGVTAQTGAAYCWPAQVKVDRFTCESSQNNYLVAGECVYIPWDEYSYIFDSFVRRKGTESKTSRYLATAVMRSFYRILNDYAPTPMEEKMAEKLNGIPQETRDTLIRRILVLQSVTEEIQSKFVIPELFNMPWEEPLDYYAMNDMIEERPGLAVNDEGECTDLDIKSCGKLKQNIGTLALPAGARAWVKHPAENTKRILLGLGDGGLANVDMTYASSGQMGIANTYQPQSGGVYELDITSSESPLVLISTWDGESSAGSIEILDYSSAFGTPDLLGTLFGRFKHAVFDDSGDYVFAYNADTTSIELYRTTSIISGNPALLESKLFDTGEPLDIAFGRQVGQEMLFIAGEVRPYRYAVLNLGEDEPSLVEQMPEFTCNDFEEAQTYLESHAVYNDTSSARVQGLLMSNDSYIWSGPFGLRRVGGDPADHCDIKIYGAIAEANDGILVAEASQGPGTQSYCGNPTLEIFNTRGSQIERIDSFPLEGQVGVMGTLDYDNGTEILFLGDDPSLNSPCQNTSAPQLRTYVMLRVGTDFGDSFPEITDIGDSPAAVESHRLAESECGDVPHACRSQDWNDGVCCGGAGYCGEQDECIYPPTVDVSDPNSRFPLMLAGHNFWDVDAVVQVSDRIESCSAANYLAEGGASQLSWIELGPGFVEGAYECGPEHKDKMTVPLWNDNGSARMPLENGLRFVRVMQCVDNEGNLELCNQCIEEGVFSEPVLVNLKAKERTVEPTGYKLMAMKLRAIESTNDQYGFAPTDEIVVHHVSFENNNAHEGVKPQNGEEHWSMDDGDEEFMNILLASGSDVTLPMLTILEEDSFGLAGVIVGAVAVVALELAAYHTGTITDVEVQAAIAAIYYGIHRAFEDLGDSDQVAQDAGHGLRLRRATAKGILRYGEECIPASWKNNTPYSINSVESVELANIAGYQEATIVKRYVSEEESGNDGPATYEVEYLLIEDSLPFGE